MTALYRILTFLIVPIGLLFGAMGLFILPLALSNPPLLLPVFAVICIGIYVFASFSFVLKGIMQQRPCRASLRDWIKVNAIVAIVFAVMMAMQVITTVARPHLITPLLDQVIAMQPEQPALNKASLEKMAWTMLYTLGAIALLLIAHIMLSFHMLRKFRFLFDSADH